MYFNTTPISKCPLNSALEFINYYRLPYIKDADNLEYMAQKAQWKVVYDLKKKAREIGSTIIVTDVNQIIVWVSNGFEKMTEYETTEAVGLTPRFLQGPKTDFETNAKVREAIKHRKVFNGGLINYKKTGAIYECDVQISPIFDHNNHLKNFIAFERES